MTQKKLKTSSDNHRPHFVDENTETVYITVRSWGGAVAAPFWVQQHYPGYKCSIVTEDGLKKKFATTEDA